MQTMKYKSLPLAIHALPLAAAFMLPNLVTPLLEIWRDEIGFSTGTLSLIFVMYLGGLAPAFLLAAGVSSRLGRKQILITACIFGILSCIGYAMASDVVTLLAARVLTGLCTGFVLVLGTEAVLATATDSETHKATLTSTIGIGLGLAGGPILASTVATLLPAPTDTVFVIEGVLLLLCIPIIFSQPNSSKHDHAGWLPFASMSGQDKRATLAGLGAFGPGMTAAAIVLALMPTILKHVGIHSVLSGGLIAGGMYLVSPIAQFSCRKVEPVRLLSLSLMTIIGAMLLLIVGSEASSLSILTIAAIAIGAGQGLSNYASFRVVHSYATQSTKSAISLLCLGVYASASVIPLLGGYLADRRGMSIATIVMAISVITISVPGLIIASKDFIRK